MGGGISEGTNSDFTVLRSQRKPRMSVFKYKLGTGAPASYHRDLLAGLSTEPCSESPDSDFWITSSCAIAWMSSDKVEGPG